MTSSVGRLVDNVAGDDGLLSWFHRRSVGGLLTAPHIANRRATLFARKRRRTPYSVRGLCRQHGGPCAATLDPWSRWTSDGSRPSSHSEVHDVTDDKEGQYEAAGAARVGGADLAGGAGRVGPDRGRGGEVLQEPRQEG